MERSITKSLKKDLDSKIVLLSGPRQVGKTTLSKNLDLSFEYLNFDDSDLRKIMMNRSWKRDVDLVIFDELHKRPKWKSWIKGIYDTEGVKPKILVTGSARMDVFKKGSDSLAGRHFNYRLHPFSVAELKGQMPPGECLERLMKVGGFPEPFLNGEEDFAKRWRSTHIDRIIKEDLLELEQVRNIKLIEVLIDLLSDRVGSSISYSSLARDLEISPHTVKKWIGILESLYVIFVVPPYSKNLARAILREPKIYFYDNGRVKNDEGARFENIVANALLRKLHLGQDLKGEKSQLYYIRDKEKREVDFLTVIDNKLIDLVEVKLSDENLSTSLSYYNERLKPAMPVQVIYNLKREQLKDNIRLVRAEEWLVKQ
ncbi:MAG: ATP-binding protein [Bacteriovorax sp.]|nr:ATP-binding protein [Bacteriovorax sp.]